MLAPSQPPTPASVSGAFPHKLWLSIIHKDHDGSHDNYADLDEKAFEHGTFTGIIFFRPVTHNTGIIFFNPIIALTAGECLSNF